MFAYSFGYFWSSADDIEALDATEEQVRREVLAARLLEKLAAAERARESNTSETGIEPPRQSRSDNSASGTAVVSRARLTDKLQKFVALPALLLRRAVRAPRYRRVAVTSSLE
jgi:aminoglycoside/choline kinase family phosphotransferase